MIDLSMAGRALQPMGKVTLMRKIDKVRQALQTHPRDRLSAGPMVEERLDPRLMCIEILMAPHAEMQAGYAGSRRLVCGAVTVETVEAELPRVKGVVE